MCLRNSDTARPTHAPKSTTHHRVRHSIQVNELLLVLGIRLKRNRLDRLHLVENVGRVILGLETLQLAKVDAVDVGNRRVASCQSLACHNRQQGYGGQGDLRSA